MARTFRNTNKIIRDKLSCYIDSKVGKLYVIETDLGYNKGYYILDLLMNVVKHRSSHLESTRPIIPYIGQWKG